MVLWGRCGFMGAVWLAVSQTQPAGHRFHQASDDSIVIYIHLQFWISFLLYELHTAASRAMDAPVVMGHGHGLQLASRWGTVVSGMA
eukprot:COSAG01_NODE_15105_length_1374_cov_0.982745_1_plen_87_part_00